MFVFQGLRWFSLYSRSRLRAPRSRRRWRPGAVRVAARRSCTGSCSRAPGGRRLCIRRFPAGRCSRVRSRGRPFPAFSLFGPARCDSNERAMCGTVSTVAASGFSSVGGDKRWGRLRGRPRSHPRAEVRAHPKGDCGDVRAGCPPTRPQVQRSRAPGRVRGYEEGRSPGLIRGSPGSATHGHLGRAAESPRPYIRAAPSRCVLRFRPLRQPKPRRAASQTARASVTPSLSQRLLEELARVGEFVERVVALGVRLEPLPPDVATPGNSAAYIAFGVTPNTGGGRGGPKGLHRTKAERAGLPRLPSFPASGSDLGRQRSTRAAVAPAWPRGSRRGRSRDLALGPRSRRSNRRPIQPRAEPALRRDSPGRTAGAGLPDPPRSSLGG